MTHLVTYSDLNMSIAASICAESGKRTGIDKAWKWTDAAIKQTEFYEQNKAILDHPRAGYWLWKPFVILDTLQRIKDGDYLIYADAGVEFVNSIQHITDRMEGDIWLFGNMYNHLHWCKADVFIPILSNDYYNYQGKQCQASVIVIRKTRIAEQFINQWLEWCCIPGMIDDSPSKLPNHPEFQEHRHDQAILACCAIRDSIPLHWWPAMYNCGAFTYDHSGYNDDYPILFHHHRCRNNEINEPGMFRDYFHQKYPDIV